MTEPATIDEAMTAANGRRQSPTTGPDAIVDPATGEDLDYGIDPTRDDHQPTADELGRRMFDQ